MSCEGCEWRGQLGPQGVEGMRTLPWQPPGLCQSILGSHPAWRTSPSPDCHSGTITPETHTSVRTKTISDHLSASRILPDLLKLRVAPVEGGGGLLDRARPMLTSDPASRQQFNQQLLPPPTPHLNAPLCQSTPRDLFLFIFVATLYSLLRSLFV